MTSDFGTSGFILVAALCGLLGIAFVLSGLKAFWRWRPIRFSLRTLTGLLFLSLGALSGSIALGMNGYQALTREEVAARIVVRPIGPRHFAATFLVPGRSDVTYDIAGDEVYVDAHILKWKPIANALGLHTAYELDRVTGRYADIEQERTAAKTVYSLSQDRVIDLFDLRKRYDVLTPFLDVQYGSGTFIPVTRPAEFEVRVSTTGLLIREVPLDADPGK